MIPVQQAYGILTSAYTQAYKEMIPPPSFMKSFFTVKTSRKATVKLEVMRGSEKIAVDVLRGSRGQRNQFSRWTQKEYLPPFYKEYFDATELDNYDRFFGNSPDVTDAEIIQRMASDIATSYIELRSKIERRKELQCAEVLDTGVVTLINGDSIDFRRRSTSQVDIGATSDYWSIKTASIEENLIAGCEFLRHTGKVGVTEVNLILSGSGWVYVKASDWFNKVANFRNVQLIGINRPETTSFGASFQGQLIAGAYIINVWTYDEVYQAPQTDIITRYWPVDKAVMFPTTGFKFNLEHGGLPTVMRSQNIPEFSETIVRQAAEYARYNMIDKNASAHYFYLMSAPLPIPVTVDHIYTMKILGNGGGEG